jgi:hypothetical protein
MKKLIIVLFCTVPCFAFAQTMDLPGAPLLVLKEQPKKSNESKVDKDAIKKAAIDQATSGTGTSSSPFKFRATVLSTNFTVPLVRVNFLERTPSNPTSLVSTSFLNSAGAGINISRGEIDQTIDGNNNVASTSYYNDWGFQVGFLFAANSSSGTSTTTTGSATTTATPSNSVFAIAAGFSILNFQLGVGYELGTLAAAQKRGFLAISYAIPISSLIKGGYKILGTPTEILAPQQ